MSNASGFRRIALAGLAFAVAFVGCMVGVPAVGLGLSMLLAPLGFGALAWAIGLPAYALWLGDLQIGHGESSRFVIDAEGYHTIPIGVWLLTCAVFAWVARNLGWWQKVLSAVVVIVTVTITKHCVLALLDVRLCLIWW